MGQFETLERRLLAEINPDQDCLRLYRMPQTRGFEVLEHGSFKAVDFDGPLVMYGKGPCYRARREPGVMALRRTGSHAS